MIIKHQCTDVTTGIKLLQCMYTFSGVHHFNDGTGLSPYISESRWFGDGSLTMWEAIRQDQRKHSTDAEQQGCYYKVWGGQSPYYVSAVKDCV